MASNAPRQKKPRADRGGRYCMVLELEHLDNTKLEKLVDRYQKLLGPAVKANKALVLRQLIRHMERLSKLPPVLGS